VERSAQVADRTEGASLPPFEAKFARAWDSNR
jgi:hypothetical protein